MHDPYAPIAEFYDLEHDGFRDDITFYLNLLEPSSILEVGVGTGRIAGALAERDFDVWGIDTSPPMLDRARTRLGENPLVHLLEASILDLELGQTFSAAILPLNTLWHFPDTESQRRCLRAIRRHLDSGGILCIDCSNPFTLADRGAAGELRIRFMRASGPISVTGMSASWDDEEHRQLHLLLIYDTTQESGVLTRSQASLDLRYLYQDELQQLLAEAGFGIRNVYGSYDLDPYTEESPNLLVIASAV